MREKICPFGGTGLAGGTFLPFIEYGVRALELGGGGRPTFSELATEQIHQRVQLGCRIHMLGKEVSGVGSAQHLPEFKLFAPEPLLHPQTVALKVP